MGESLLRVSRALSSVDAREILHYLTRLEKMAG